MFGKKGFTYHHLMQLFDEAEEMVNSLTENAGKELLLQKPDPNRWNVAQCIRHLIRFGSIYYDRINSRLEGVQKSQASPNTIFKPRFHFKMINNFLEPPYRLKTKTLSPFKPENTSIENLDETIQQFLDLQQRFIDQLKRCRQKGFDLSNIKISNPVFPFIKMTLIDSYSLILTHQRRHFWQAKETLKQIKQS